MNQPSRFEDAHQLEEAMSRPSAALVADLKRVPGDIMVLGVGGKMGPTLARMARRASPGRRVRRCPLPVARCPLPVARCPLPTSSGRVRPTTGPCARWPTAPRQRRRLSVQQDLALANLLGITHVERHGHHYVNGMAAQGESEQQAFLGAHSDV